MSKIILALLTILPFIILQIFAQEPEPPEPSVPICKKPQETPPQGSNVVKVSIFNDYFDPDCLTVKSGQIVVWGMY